jgi:hypothetical protein
MREIIALGSHGSSPPVPILAGRTLRDTASQHQRGALKHGSEVLCLAIAPQDEALAAGTWDRAVIVWEGRLLDDRRKKTENKP